MMESRVLRLWRDPLMELHLKSELRLQLFLFDLRSKLLLLRVFINFQLILSSISLIATLNILHFMLSMYDYIFSIGSKPLLLNILLNIFWILFNLFLDKLPFLIRKITLNSYKLETILPEEWQADLKTLQERWIKQNYSCQKIRFLTIKHIFHMVLGYIQIQLENIWLPNNVSTKEIE